VLPLVGLGRLAGGVTRFRCFAAAADQGQGEASILFIVPLRVIIWDGIAHAHHHGQAGGGGLNLGRLVRDLLERWLRCEALSRH